MVRFDLFKQRDALTWMEKILINVLMMTFVRVTLYFCLNADFGLNSGSSGPGPCGWLGHNASWAWTVQTSTAAAQTFQRVQYLPHWPELGKGNHGPCCAVPLQRRLRGSGDTWPLIAVIPCMVESEGSICPLFPDQFVTLVQGRVYLDPLCFHASLMIPVITRLNKVAVSVLGSWKRSKWKPSVICIVLE